MRIKIIAPLSSLKKRVRLFKLVNFLTENGVEWSSYSWERIAGEADDDFPDIRKRIILRGGGYGKRKTKIFYFFWMGSVFFNALFSKEKHFYCLGFESAFPVFLVSKLKAVTFIFDDADRFSMLFKSDNTIKRFLKHLEYQTSLASKCHIVPNSSRYPDFASSGKLLEIKNTPELAQIKRAKKFDLDSIINQSSIRAMEERLVIYFNGWLSDQRGADTLFRILELDRKQKSPILHILMAGKLDGKFSELLSSCEEVTYIGSVENYQALSAYSVADFVFTYYNPINEINRYAESNKWGDAIAMGVPILVNSEVATATDLIVSGLGISASYADAEEMYLTLIEYYKNPTLLTALKNKVGKASIEMPAYEGSLKKVFL